MTMQPTRSEHLRVVKGRDQQRGINLSRRETEVANLVSEGLTNRQIGERLFIAERTAEGHVEQIRNKLGFSTRSQIAAWVAGQGADTSGGRRLSGLPSPLSSLVGRTREIKTISDLAVSTHLLTITGPGGVGKTRLAIEVAHRIANGFRDGAWLVELAAVSSPALVAPTIVQTLKLAQTSAEPPDDQLARVLAGRRTLLVIDNCEHLVDACAQLMERLLKYAPGLRVVATSREPLGVAGERLFRVEPLSWAAPVDERSPALELLLQRCYEAGVPVFSEDALRHGTAICKRLDGMPLAIELAAAQSIVLTLAEIESRLDDRFNLLKSRVRTALPRHQTLLATVDWSYRLLGIEEQRAFRHLGVFVGGFDVAAAASVLELDESATIAVLGSLLRKSMLAARSERDRPIRYEMPDTLRQYAVDQLEHEDEADVSRDRHADYYMEMARTSYPQMRAAGAEQWTVRLDLEQGNISAALRFLSTRSGERFPAMVAAMSRYWARSRIPNEDGWTEPAMSRPNLTAEIRLDLLAMRTWLAWHDDDPNLRFKCANDLLEAATQFGDEARIGRAMNMIAVFRVDAGQQVDPSYWRDAEIHLRRSGDTWLLASLLNDLGMLQIQAGDVNAALPRVREALTLAKRLGDEWLVVRIVDSAAWAHVELGLLEDAGSLFAEGAAIVLASSSHGPLSIYLEGFARILRLKGHPEFACRIMAAAAALRDRIGGSVPAIWMRYVEVESEGLRESLGQTQFEACWQAGLSTSEEEAVELAQTELKLA